ncbi:replication initiator [Streptomyces sp. enrichment culture]|uniref:replication initiator n=1 Tax=Streptomyces sp. enrichment culture TaxID=1795815 RepID=UPI003F560BA8
MEACWDLDDAHPDRLLWRWAHMLGFRGHFSTKSRRHSTTLGELRQARADYRARQERRERGFSEDLDDVEASTLALAHWTYAGQGHIPGESWLAASIARDLRLNRETAREACLSRRSGSRLSSGKELELAKQAAGELWPDSDFVFTTRYGTPFEPRNFNRRFVDRSTRAGVRQIRLHDTRHTCGSLLAALDVHPRVAMQILRHSKMR